MVEKIYGEVVTLYLGRKKGGTGFAAVADIVLKIAASDADKFTVAVFFNADSDDILPDKLGRTGQKTRLGVDGQRTVGPVETVEHIVDPEAVFPHHIRVGRRVGRLRHRNVLVGSLIGCAQAVHHAVAVEIAHTLVKKYRKPGADVERRPSVEFRAAVALVEGGFADFGGVSSTGGERLDDVIDGDIAAASLVRQNVTARQKRQRAHGGIGSGVHANIGRDGQAFADEYGIEGVIERLIERNENLVDVGVGLRTENTDGGGVVEPGLRAAVEAVAEDGELDFVLIVTEAGIGDFTADDVGGAGGGRGEEGEEEEEVVF